MILSPPTGKQARSIVEANARLNIWHGSVRSSKTIGSILRWLYYVAQDGPDGELLMAGKTERTLKHNVLDPMIEMVGSDLKYTTGTGEGRLFGRRLYVAGANDERAENKIRGLTLAGIYGDEISTWPEGFFKQGLARMSVKGAKGFFTTNPDAPQHWLKRDYLDRTEELNLRAFHFTLDDNPTLDPQYVADLKREYTGLWFKRFILGQWVQAEGAIFDMWDEERFVVRGRFPRSEEHVKPGELPHMSRKWVSIDYGTVNPFVAILWGLGEDGKVYAMSEYRWDSRKHSKQKTDVEYSAAVRDWLQYHAASPEWFYVDPSAASFIQQLWRDGFEGVRPAKNDVIDGIRISSAAIAQDRVRVHESCTGLMQEIPGYVWDAKAQKRGEDKPIKTDDHSVDAMRYGLASTQYVWGRLHVMAEAS